MQDPSVRTWRDGCAKSFFFWNRDEQSEHFAFVVLDGTGTLFRFGYCRRSNREATCLCLIR